MPRDLLQPSHSVRLMKNVLIPLSDGTRLAADLFMPEPGHGGENGPYPAVLEYLPYRKDDFMAGTANVHRYFAERGFASIHVDIRGTGGSEGVAADEYTPQEQRDACEVIDWLSRQPWCNGNVGMFGTSYGGFNSIQTAMHAPPALRAIVPHAATDDRYNDDVHFYGGCLTGIDQVLYPLWMVAMNAMPPHPEYAGADWAAIWHNRLQNNPVWMIEWLRHHADDDYWRQASLKTDYGSIKAAVYHMGGWADGYTNPVFRMLEHLQAPNKALVGPWTHLRPHQGWPGPAMNHLHEMTRWWAHWLRDEDTGIMQEPPVALYIQHGAAPDPFLKHMPGQWRYEEKWPPDRVEERPLYFAGESRLAEKPESQAEADEYRYRATTGITRGFWCPLWPPYGLARDQAADEARSLAFTGPRLEAPLEILGRPRAVLHVSSTAEIAFFVVKLSDVAPDGTSTLVSGGVLNATHRHSHSQPEALVPGEVYELEIDLKVVSWVFQPGHRLRVAISCSDWPIIWPSPQPAINTLYRGGARPSRILLPVARPPERPLPEPQFLPPPQMSRSREHSARPTWSMTQDAIDGLTVVRVAEESRGSPEGAPFEIESQTASEAGASDDQPDRAYAKGTQRFGIVRRDSRTDVVGRASVRSTARHLHVDIEQRVTVDGELFFQRGFVETIERFFI
jgi:putative CocE/NonD family hydrolase